MIEHECRGSERRIFLKMGLGGLVWAGCPCLPWLDPGGVTARPLQPEPAVRAITREAVLFAGIRKPISKRAELEPRIAQLTKVCAGRIAGPLMHIFRYDTPVEGHDSEIGFPVSADVNDGEIRTHRLRAMACFSLTHEGPLDTLNATATRLYGYMDRTGLSPELELTEVYHHRDPAKTNATRVEIMASYLDWANVYRAQLTRVLGRKIAETVWKGGERITPHTLVDERCAWVAESIARLKTRTDLRQQFDILSRVALVRPPEDVAHYKAIYDRSGRIDDVFQALAATLATTRTGGFVDAPRFDGKVLHLSKVPYNRKQYDAARTHEDRRRAHCFCALVREARDPKIDPIFCYRAAGWDRQFWEPIPGRTFPACRITHSILKGDDFCAWDYNVQPRS